MITLFHGSNQKIEVPDLVHSKPFKDFLRHQSRIAISNEKINNDT